MNVKNSLAIFLNAHQQNQQRARWECARPATTIHKMIAEKSRWNQIFLRVGPFGIATIFQAAASILSLALILRLLSKDNFSHWVLIEPSTLLLAQVALLGANHGAIKVLAQGEEHPSLLYRKATRLLLIPLATLATFASFLVQTAYEKPLLSVLLGIYVALESTYLFQQAILRGAQLASKYSHIVLIRSSSTITGLVGCYLYTENSQFQPIELIATINIAALLAAISYGHTAIHRTSKPTAKFSTKSLWLSLVGYGYPLLIVGIINIVLANADRFFINGVSTDDELAAYAVHTRISNIIAMIATPVTLWFSAARFVALKQADGGNFFFRRTARIVNLTYSVCASLFFSLSPALFSILAPSYTWRPEISSFLVASAYLVALTPIFNVGLMIDGRTLWNALISALSAALLLAILFGLGRDLTPFKAAAAVFCVQALSFALQATASNFLKPVISDWKVLLLSSLSCFAATIIGAITSLNFSLLLGLLLQVAMLSITAHLVLRPKNAAAR